MVSELEQSSSALIEKKFEDILFQKLETDHSYIILTKSDQTARDLQAVMEHYGLDKRNIQVAIIVDPHYQAIDIKPVSNPI